MTAASTPVLAFEFPLPANRGNARFGHFYAEHRSKKRYWALLDTLAMVRRLPRAPTRPFGHAAAEITLRTYRRQDEDNAHARLKDVCDWLRTRGYIADDNPAAFTYTLSCETAKLADCGVLLILREVAG
jgi:hypothetical protein